LKQFRLYKPNNSGNSLHYIIRNSSEFGRLLAHKKLLIKPIFSLILTGQTTFYHVFWPYINGSLHSMHHPSQISPYTYPWILYNFSFHHLTFSHSLFFYNVLPLLVFIQKCYSNFLGIVWMGKKHGATLQICIIYLGVKLTCWGVSLTIKSLL